MTETGSTNADLLALAATGDTGPVVLVADHQTAGRGRQGRRWHDEPGSALLVSVLIGADPGWAGLCPLVAGLAAVDVVDNVLAVDRSVSPVGLKWPNDVLVADGGDAKLAGVLVEARTGAAAGSIATGGSPGEARPLMAVVIGLGLNLAWTVEPPSEIADRATTLERVGQTIGNRASASTAPGRDNVLLAYLGALDRWLTVVTDTGGRSRVLDRYRQRCLTLGRTVTFTTAAGTITGTADGLGDNGELLVTDGSGRRHTVMAGDAHHRPPDRGETSAGPL